ncbi:TPA_exp: Uncharacterized protein A8136_0367 [Trichophyton benhamiae CBS 112371]|nr:TPA_exp: Uncharacterized protein A8136_0367 [Trichophyton benhamiae CBS 112371]
MEVISPGAANGVPSPTVSMTVDPEVVLHYLAEVIQGTLGALRRDLESSGSLLSQAKYSETLQRCGRFASESQIALYAHKDTVVPEQTNGSDDDTEHSNYVYTLSSELSISPTTTAAMAVFKPGQPIDPAVPLYSQIQVLTLPGFASLNNSTTPQGPPISPYEIIYSFVHHGLSPYYEACTRGHDGAQGSKGRNDTDPKTGEVRAKQKFAELELALSHLQQNIEIPALSLPLHEIVQAALDEAQSRGIEPSVELVPAAVLDNHAVINSIQNNVNGWIKSIQAITKMSRDPDNGSAVQEINFWLSMETALEGIETALRDAGVQLTMDVLRHAKRFSTTLSFSADTGLKEAMETVQKYNQLLRDFPLDELESATSLQKVQEALNLIFSHLNKKLRICPYPIKRALSLVAAISGDLDLTIHKLIPGRSIMHYDYTEFHSLMRAAQIVWRTWDENIKEFTNVARDAMRRRNEKFIPIKVKPKHAETQDRLKFINTFRTNHEQLQRTIINVLGTKSNQGGASLSAGADNSTALEEFGDVDAVEQVTQAYNALKDVDVLDVSPEGTQAWIQAESAYNERTSRVENLMIARLRDKLATAQNANEKFRVFSKFNALLVRPKIRSAIGEYQTKLIDNVKQDIAALHERFKQQYGHSEAHAMAQLRDLPPVSGAIIWAQQIERQLDGYMRKVEDVLGEDWDLHADGQKLQAESNMFRKKLDTRPVFQAWVQDVKRRNIAISGRLFVITRNRAAGNSLELAVNFDAQIIALFKEVRNLVWLNFQIPHAITSVSKEAKRVYPFAISLMESVRTLHQTIRAIASMSQSAILLNGYQNDVQALIVKGLPLRWESFIHSYEIHVKQGLANGSADPSVSSGRGESKHVQFVREFAISTSVLQSKTATLATMDDNIQKAILALKTCPYDVTVFRNRIDQIQIAIDKLNLENYANLGYWVANLNTKIETILQDRLRGAIRRWIASFQHAGDEQSGTGHTIEASGNKEEQDTSYIQFPKSLHEISMKNQVMHLDPPLEYARASWFAHFDEWVGVLCNLEKIKSSRYKMSIHADNGSYSETHFSDIPQYCSEELSEVYSLIEARLEEISEYVDKWLQFQSLWDLQSSHVYDILGEDLSQWLQLLHEIRKSRGTFDTSEVRRSFGNVRIDYEQVQTKVNAKYDQWQREILLKFAGKLGARMRDVHAELEAARRDLEGQSLEASSTAQAVSFITIVQQCKRKAKLWEPEIDLFLQGQATLIRQRYQAPSDWLPADRVSGEWDALNEILERRKAVNQWNEEKPVSGSTPPEEASATLSYFQSRLEKLQSESEMVSKAKEALDLPSSPETTLAAILEEVQDFMASLDGLIKMTKEMPSRMRQERHWQKIFKALKPGKRFSQISMTLGDGEMALEEFLRSVRETWQSYTLDLAMRHSPYYKEFEEEATTWEDKLTRVHVLFDVWIDVQRQWVYLEGVFTGNADIKHLLPLESGRFQNINSEFFAVMKKVYKSPLVLDVLAITGVQKSLERLAELLHKIQKALGEYLEKERVSFPRFYFVGDEDLLEIIGNSNDTLRVAKHFKKMFAGLSGLLIDDDVKTPRINDWLTALDNNVKLTLAELLTEAIEQFEPIYSASEVDSTAFQDYIANYPAQIVVLGSQVVWTNAVQKALEAGGGGLSALYDAEVRVLDILALTVLGDLDPITRKKCEHLITEFVHQRDAIAKLMSVNASSPTHYLWLLQMRYVYQPTGDFLQRLYIHMANAKLSYGFEYLALCQRLALGLQLGRFTLVFCCDDTFDFQAMGRIFLGICQIGLKNSEDETKAQIDLVGRQLRVNMNTGIFITMNPGYAGRSNLPDNLKKLFRSVAMSKPDKELIAEVMLFSQGFKQAKPLSRQTVPFFDHCASRLSKQAHYDFGLRALKSVLVSSGGLKRLRLANSDGDIGPDEYIEPQIIVQSIRETIAPKLIREDVETLLEIQASDFPGVEYVPANFENLTQAIKDIAAENHYVASDIWIAKILQLYQIQGIHHGVMMVGSSGAEALYGNLDNTTREWTDGLFTGILRKVVDNLRGEDSKRHWIVFDGDVDPEWVENLNSVLDDNKLLTLPNGERLNLPPNVRVMFEVENLKYATLATSSAKTMATQGAIATFLGELLSRDDVILNALQEARKYTHIMEYKYNIQHVDFPLEPEQTESYMSKKLLLALVWSLTGDCPLGDSASLIDYDVSLPKAEWIPWQSQVPSIEINTHSVTQTDVIIPTLDTVRHEDVLYSWLAEHKPLLLCGPPGSGKTMTLFSALRKLPNMEVVGLNFSSATTPDLLIKTQIGRWLVIFCDEINLPARDQYGTQRAISFLRQLVEQNGFWRTSDKTWITLDRIQFVGACNPPTDAGRTPLGERFLRHAPLVMVDYPGEISLLQIYGTFNSAVLKIIPMLRGYSEALTKAMVQFYLESQARFTTKIQPHYVYSPRELTRWVRGVYEAIKPLENLSIEGLVRIWAHEALRLFQDRLVDESEQQWTAESVKRIALEHFPNIDENAALSSPILFSNWLSKNYVPVEQEQLRDFVKARLRTFCEEEVDVPLVLFNDVLEHALRIDRVFRQPQGHLILIGIKVHGKYSGEDFDEDLRSVLRRAGCKGEKICFIMDEANVLDSGFLERMNTLLANAEVPEGAQRQGLLLDSQEELYKWFTQQIVNNLHVVFTMNPPEDGLSSKAATSPALFNRCVLNWMGDWSDQALYQVGYELTQSVDLDKPNFIAPDSIPVAYRGLSLPASHRDTVVNAMQDKSTYLTPRHYLDFVAHYVKLFNEKREDLEEQQRHLNVGLEKLRDTVDKVRDLRASLAQKKNQLEKKDAEANEKLQRMVADQREAEQRKSASLEIQTALEKQEKEVATRKEIVLNDLANAEPAVLEAQKSVSNIKKQHLTEVRSMSNPPSGVRLALESDDFIASIVNYDNERQMTRQLRAKMLNEFLSKEEFSFERVNHASKACGPLVQWVQAQVHYSSILDRVGPLREEVGQLEEQALQTKAEAQAIENTINDLENSIATYKVEYAALISETQAIKSEMSRVEFKVDRSVRLLDSLSSERSRWEEGSKTFETQISTLVGDVLIAAAFLAYGGLYDQQFRKAMIDDWMHHLSQSNIDLKPHNPVTEYPLIIDPSGRVTEFLEKENRDRKLTVTSFLDDSFVKQLESALRFGNPILIQDAEHLDPILNHVLNKEYQKTGGRVLIQLGKQEIDFSPSFKLFLSTLTQSSLQTQSLNEVLKSERPDVDERRTNLIKVQGEFKIHLRQLEKKLLQALNESRGNILDDDNVIETLETLKKEAWEISNKMVETEGVMAEVDNITLQYNIIARSCSAVFAYFVDIFNDVLHNNKRLAQERDYTARVNIILRDLFIAAFQRTSLGLLQKDRVTLAVLLAQASPYPMDKGLIDMILDTTVEGCDVSTDGNLRESAMSALAQMSVFKSKNFVPNVWDEGTSQLDQQLRSLLLVKLLRLDRFVPAAERFVVTVFGKGLLDDNGDLKEVVEQVTSTTPIALSSSPGFDASYKVDGLVERTHRSCANIAMGSNEGLESADKAISNAAATGSWVLVKNVHLAPSWLQSLEKRLESLKPHKDFRLFLSMESSPKIPVNLIRASRVLMYEQPAGVRANVKDSLSSLSLRAASPPVEKTRLYLLLSFLHAVIQERLRYAPSLGWKGFWEFNDSDYECSAFIIDTWVASIAQGRSNVAPQKIPWDLIRTLITETYGGKIDDAGDFALLAKLVDTFLTPAAFEDDHKLVPDVENDEALILPTSTGIQDFLAWVNRLPEREPPTYLGLPANAEKLLLVGHGKRMISNLSKITTLLDEGEQLMVETAAI